MVQSGGGELFFVDDEDDLQDSVRLRSRMGFGRRVQVIPGKRRKRCLKFRGKLVIISNLNPSFPLGRRVNTFHFDHLGPRTPIVELGLGCEDSVYRPF